jgi:hypothetical protein
MLKKQGGLKEKKEEMGIVYSDVFSCVGAVGE